MRLRQDQPSRVKALPSLLRVLACALPIGVVACAAQRTAPPAPNRAVLLEADLPPSNTPRIRIVDLHEAPEQNGAAVVIVGTVVNLADAETNRLVVRVEGLDEKGHVLTAETGLPETQKIPPRGTTPFRAVFAARPDVVGFHAEAFAHWTRQPTGVWD
jgi:hypothetical protein